MSEMEVTNEAVGADSLDNVIWNALTGRQGRFAVGNDRALRFASSVAPFTAMIDSSAASFDALRELIDEHGPLTLATVNEIEPDARFSVTRRASLLQMVWQGDPAPSTDVQYVNLDERDVPDMLALTAATQPGPFGPRTIELGDYIGTRQDGKLAAMAGERMKIDGYTEVSAVCVDPAFRGQGLAGGLMKRLITAICARGETPFLHVLASNHGALALYRAMGFVVRRELHLMGLQRA
ncbi:GNAT family N-acetyltransferase [Paraburkholderia sp. ZP32-5]|uniref:GNAT family N-acetyltransferase n=1 Tax=Paraburkholderia sp. ZP32-5 TaxID=2883245 RepID=UPI001F407E69|nr:GNAT family N-acetyltransferase [Paraburkholderia sp. ZP32-5]